MAEVWRDGEMWRLIEHCGLELVWRLSRIRNTRQDCFTYLHTSPVITSTTASHQAVDLDKLENSHLIYIRPLSYTLSSPHTTQISNIYILCIYNSRP